METTLYSIPISHPARAAGLMLRHKGIEAERVEMMPGAQQVAMRRHGFRHGTVPGLKLDGKRIQGTLKISRALDAVQPDPPLFPSDPARRAAVEEAERWGNDTYQPVPRRIFRWAVANSSEAREMLARGAKMPAPGATSKLLLPVSQIYMRFEGGGEKQARQDVAELPAHIDHVDELIAAGTLNGEELNAADFQIATTTRVLLNYTQLRPFIDGRPAAEHAMRVIPNFGRELPLEIPPEWIPTDANVR